MEKITIKLQCPKCGSKLSAAINKGTNIAQAKLRCCNANCGYVGKGIEFLLIRQKFTNEHACPKCGATWQTSFGSKEILTCPKCGNTENIIPKIKHS